MSGKRSPEQAWLMALQGTIPGLRRLRRLFKVLPADQRCKNCNAPLSGSGAVLMRLMGRRPYGRNPRFCNWCMRICQASPGGAEITLSLLFADVRGSVSLAETMTAPEFSALMNRFYSVVTEVLIRTDALIDKLVGDEVIGLYLPGYAGIDHGRRAVEASRALLSAVGYGTTNGPWLPIGVGVHTGVAYVGTVQGTEGTVTDFTALGDAVNVASRLAAQARPGEALVSDAAWSAARMSDEAWEQRTLTLKGRSEPVGVRVLAAGGL